MLTVNKLHRPRPGEAALVNVFAAGSGGGNPAPIVIDASGMNTETMRSLAARYGHESAFVLPGRDGCDFHFRFFVPNHEMEMCGHATLGAVWLLDQLGLLPSRTVSIATLSGVVQARAEADGASVSQPEGHYEPVANTDAVLDVLGLKPSDLLDTPVVNAATSRVKTLVPLRSRQQLDTLQPDYARMRETCDAINSTGLYPFAVLDPATGRLAARQFPRSSGYPEDAATGIAAAALAWAAHKLGITPASVMTVRQGEAMGRPSEITVTLAEKHCWLSGRANVMEKP